MNILEEIYQHKLVEVRERKKKISLDQICAQIKCSKPSQRNFFTALQEKNENAQIGLICEIKKASPSHGIIREDFNAAQIAKIYTKSGATCISVLTDEKYFMGSHQYLRDVRAVSDLPILQKDFVVDAYQIYEAKNLGADCILLIAAMLDDKKLAELENTALEMGLSVLVEVHSEEELRRALKLKTKLLGINNRNLKTLKTSLETSLSLVDQVPQDYVIVSESGITDVSDISILQQVGINCFLIGEYLMRQKDIEKAVRSMLEIAKDL